MLEITNDSHLDHGLTRIDVRLNWLLELFAGADAFFLKTLEIPAHMEGLRSALYGPLVGDLPISENAVRYTVRGARKCASRVVSLPTRETRLITVIAGPSGDKPCVLYTAYGGPAAPREPGDPDIKTWEELEKSRVFWAGHALAKDA